MPRGRPSRAEDTREAIVQAAFALVDAEGPDALTMRRLGREVGLDAATLYHYLPGREAVLDAVVERLRAEVAVPDPFPAEWDTMLEAVFCSYADVLARHPRLVPLAGRRTAADPAVDDEPRLNERHTHCLAVNTHPPADGPHRDAGAGEAHSLRLLVEAEPRSTARHVAPTEVGEHRGAVDAIPFGQGLDTHPRQVVTDKLVHLGGSEKSLSRLDSPHDGPPIVPRSATLGSCGHLVDAPQQAVDQGFCLGGGVAERAT